MFRNFRKMHLFHLLEFISTSECYINPELHLSFYYKQGFTLCKYKEWGPSGITQLKHFVEYKVRVLLY